MSDSNNQSNSDQENKQPNVEKSLGGFSLLSMNVEGVILEVNNSFADLFEISKDDLKDQPIEILRVDDEKDELVETLIQIPQSDESVYHVKNSLGDSFLVTVAYAGKNLHILIKKQESEETASLFTRFISPEKKTITASFINIHNLPKYTEELDVATFSAMVEVIGDLSKHSISSNEGHVRRFSSDGFLSLFGAQKLYREHALKAIDSSLDFITDIKIEKINRRGENLHLPQMGIGIHTSKSVVGKLGSSTNKTYTAVGESVEIAKKISKVAKQDQVLISQDTLEEVLNFLPDKWVSKRFRPKNTEDTSDGSLHPQGWKKITIGPNLEPVYSFNYEFTLKMKQSDSTLAVMSVSRVNLSNRDLLETEEAKSEEYRPFGKYQLIQLVGKGGVGEVWKAKDQFGNTVAIKTLQIKDETMESDIQRFLAEADILSKLHHRGICRIHEVGKIDKINYIAMEYIEGVPLSDILTYKKNEDDGTHQVDLIPAIKDLQERTVTEPPAQPPDVFNTIFESQAIAITKKICEAIQFAHEFGILHRDIKPHNIMMRIDGEPIIMDFGIAKDVKDTTREGTLQGQLFGTIEYMAPEQAALKENINEKVDVFSIGAVFYQMLTGRKHFKASQNILQDIKRLQYHEPLAPRFYKKQISGDLNAILLKALQNSPKDRYGTAKQLNEELERYQIGDPISAQPPNLIYHIRKKTKKHLLVVMFSLSILLILAFFSGYLFWESEKEFGNWVKLFEQDFSLEKPDLESLEIRDPFNKKTDLDFQTNSNGVKLPPNHWCWIKNIPKEILNKNIRVVMKVNYKSLPEQFILSLNARDDIMNPNEIPRGYSLILGDNQGSLDRLVKIDKRGKKSIQVNSSSSNYRKKSFEFSFERRKENLTYFWEGEEHLSALDYQPIIAKSFDNIGFKSSSDTVYLKSIEIYRLSLPEKASPLIAADALISSGNLEKAINELRIIAEDYHGSLVAQNAIIKAFGLTLENPEKLGSYEKNLKDYFYRFYPNSPLEGNLLAKEAIYYWNSNQFDKALSRLYLMSEKDQEIDLSDQINTDNLNPEQMKKFLEYLKSRNHQNQVSITHGANISHKNLNGIQTQQFKGINLGLEELSFLSNLPVKLLELDHNFLTDISAISEIPVEYLSASYNLLTDLSSLQGMPLNYLNLNHNNVENTTPLKALPLNILHLSGNLITDIYPLQSLSVRILNLSYNQIADVSALKYLPAERLDLSHNQISDLNVIPDKNLTWLNLNHNQIEHIQAISGSQQLKTLSLGNNQISDISPLTGMELAYLNLSDNQVSNLDLFNSISCSYLELNRNKIKELSTLYGQKLKSLYLEGNKIKSLKPIQKLNLSKISFKKNKIRDLRPLNKMNLNYLNCEQNPIRNWGKFLKAPPDTFYFENKSMSARFISKLIGEWRNLDNQSYNIHYSKILLYSKQRNLSQLKRLGNSLNGHRYLHITKKMSFDAANQYCKRFKGHLVTINNQVENDFIQSIMKDNHPIWIGLKLKKGEKNWLTDEKLTYFPTNSIEIVGEQENVIYRKLHHNYQNMWDYDLNEAGFIIEWDK